MAFVNLLPRDENVWLLVAESVHLEPDSGKVSLSGWFGTERIKIAADTPLPTTMALTFVFVLKEGVGIFFAEFQIRDPDGHIAHTEPLEAAQKLSAKENHGIVVTMAPFVVSAFGTYRLILMLDGKRYKRTLTIDPDTEAFSAKTAH
jgi:hypothetical protein